MSFENPKKSLLGSPHLRENIGTHFSRQPGCMPLNCYPEPLDLNKLLIVVSTLGMMFAQSRKQVCGEGSSCLLTEVEDRGSQWAA